MSKKSLSNFEDSRYRIPSNIVQFSKQAQLENEHVNTSSNFKLREQREFGLETSNTLKCNDNSISRGRIYDNCNTILSPNKFSNSKETFTKNFTFDKGEALRSFGASGNLVDESSSRKSVTVGNFENSLEDDFSFGIIVRQERTYSIAWSLIHGLMSISGVNYVGFLEENFYFLTGFNF